MRVSLLLCLAAFCGPMLAQAAQFQGVLADWDCVKPMVQNGRGRTLRENRSCSLEPNYSRANYGLITDDKKYYKLDDAGRGWALKLLKDTHAKDNLRVVVTGDVDGDVIHVTNMSEW
jgi:hypothetical protein